MIVGTAGHIDHGKTTLTRALTGVHTDRLKEEQARGISIELGYAYLPLADGTVLGVIDVPGHEKFIRTMASGVTGIDFALLVVAADDGVMPQTHEHLAILRLLGVTRGAVALTKVDRADAARVAQVEADIEALLAGTPLAGSPIFPTAASRDSDPGVAALLAHLTQVARTLPRRDERRLFRLGVDRVFTLSGQGTVVTGTALAGMATVGDSLQLAPGGVDARVRSIHAQNRASGTGMAGQRLALNLAGIDRARIERGNWIVAPELAQCSERVDVELTLLPDAGVQLKAWSPLHVHLGAAHQLARAVMLDGETLGPGQTGRVQLVFDAPMHAVPGDRFVVRNAQATQTVGGGMVLDPFGPARKRRSPARLAWLDALAAFVAHGDIGALLAQSPLGMRESLLVRLSLLPAAAIALPPETRRIALRGGDALLLAPPALLALEARVLAALAAFHARAPDEAGPELWRLKRIVDAEMEDALWSHLVDGLLAQGGVQARGASLHLPTHSVELTPQEQAVAEPMLAALLQGRFDPPWTRDLARDFGLAEDESRRLLRKLAKAGQISQVVHDLFYHPAALAGLAQLVRDLAQKAEVEASLAPASGAVSAAAFRDASGLGRKRAIQVLEFFDRVGYTRRVGNGHLLRPQALWSYSAALPNS
ncbi:selenocysteine-specific translation elongation factor [Janthinobacterium sp. BJB1]|uniref:selenocysteine-specific translation elongation factor n=3 Tax=Janthinobacterium sp. GW458P TaxID=1981504 RepID=UPI000C0D2698|nr:selenocysteine-specific translation elongation factor [Janthinobacterium sp. GW458P]MBE3025490.1 selenocysteine-specific translation elongation factor [Janthinobacterium sp. GW458P]PHV14439.1 selenocysteine-specific translation elongation factor [Janthinobacterium sp. BJB303]PJD00429.1 selenocysteine-specific translation elongation factor [Janthinobacterium sp. BJB1]